MPQGQITKTPTNRTESVEVWLRGQYSFSNPASRTETLFARSPNVASWSGHLTRPFFSDKLLGSDKRLYSLPCSR